MDGFLTLSMVATINLNTSLNQHSLPWSLSFTCMSRFWFVLYGVVFVRDYVTCIIMILGTLWMLFLFLGTLNEINFS